MKFAQFYTFALDMYVHICTKSTFIDLYGVFIEDKEVMSVRPLYYLTEKTNVEIVINASK